MQVLVVHEHFDKWKMCNFNLSAALKAEIHWAANSAEAIEFLLQDQPIDLLICESGSEMLVLKYLASVDQPTPYLLVCPEGSSIEAFPEMTVIGRVSSLEEVERLEDLVSQARNRGNLKIRGEEDIEYCRIATELLLKVVPLKADIYIRLSRIKFVKMFRSGQTFRPEDAMRYMEEKKVDYLYIHKDEAAGMVQHFADRVAEMVESDEVPVEQAPEMAAAILDSVVDLGNCLGFTEEVQRMAKKGVDMAMKSIGSSPKLQSMVDFVRSQKGTYFSSHSIALSHIACGIAAKMEWPSESTFTKLAMAAFFHDVMLRNPALAEIETVKDMEEKGSHLSSEELSQVRNHSMGGAEVLRQFREMPPDVDVIVAQHHERPDGSGFPRKLTSHHIAPLAAVFIVAHDLVQFIYEAPEDTSFEAFVKRFGYTQDHTIGNFAKAIKAIDFPLLFHGEVAEKVDAAA